jgi:translation initiation factor IF-3
VYLPNEENQLVKMTLRQILNSMDHKIQWVELVAVNPQPVVKIIDKKAAFALEKDLRGRQRASLRKNAVKEVQLTWGSELSDLEHKLARVREYLEIGAKVDIVFSNKPKTVPPSVEVMKKKVQDTVTMMADISKEWKPVEWRKNMAAIFLQGTADPNLAEELEKEAKAEDVAEERQEIQYPDPQLTANATPVPAKSEPITPGTPKYFKDLSEFGYQPPVRRNPLTGMKEKKRYGHRKHKAVEST